MLGEIQDGAYLLMEWIEPGEGNQGELVATLAYLHKAIASQFCYRKNNYLGIFPQINTFEEEWWMFFFKNRLES